MACAAVRLRQESGVQPLNHPLMSSDQRRLALRAGLAAGLALALPSARACEYFSPTLRVTHPWTRASAPGASTAKVSMKFDDVSQDDRLIAVHTPVASGAELAGPGVEPGVRLAIPSGQETLLSEAGVHLRLTGLQLPLEVGRSYPLQLVFERGGVVRATLNVDYARFL
jgi:copper(I)-binding protein